MRLGAQAAAHLPYVPALHPLYSLGVRLPAGEVIMIAGRSGTMKSLFCLWLAYWLRLPVVYFSADMTASTVAHRLAAAATGEPMSTIRESLHAGSADQARYSDALASVPISFVYDSPVTWEGVDETLDAYVELWDTYPAVIVVDNLMDVTGAAADYTGQMEAMSALTELSRATGATVIVLHHATDKTLSKTDPWKPPARSDIKGGLSEKPALSLAVSHNPNNEAFLIAPIKNRHGFADPTGETYAALHIDPERCQFSAVKPLPGSTSTFTRSRTHER
ncbi:AAA family ATPase [Salininema proteolyticum]|uniref:AAA family ATPase n=1 Tax=Salininema proteolyticum TaxID=1607685 RepID=A0ABV8TU37_9ACTN